MAFGSQADLTAKLGIDFSQAEQDMVRFARNVPTVKAKVDISGLGQISRQANEFEKSLGSAQARVASFALAAGAVYSVSRAFEQLVKSTIEVEKDLANINVVFNLSSNQLKKFSSDLFGIANLTGQSFKTVAQVALDFSRQGLNASETLKRTADAMTLVRIGGTDLETSVKAITATLNTFNEVGLDSTAILNKIATVDTKFSVSGGVIAEALTRVSATAKDAGVSFDSLIGITTALQQITSRGGAVIGNSLKSIFQRIQRPEVIDQLNQMGIATEDLNGNMLSADAILTKVAKSYEYLSQAQQQQITQLAAGLFQANQFKAIIGDLAKENGIAARATIISSTATDQATRRQEELNKTLAAQLQVSLNNLEQFAAKAGQISIAPVLKNIFNIGGAITGDTDVIGRNIGEGMLRGLGNYLSGPGLALIGVLLGKFFLQFSSYIGESLTTVLKTGSARYEQEQKISALLSSETGLMQQLVALGGNQEAKQKLILDFFSQQNQMLSAQLALSKEIQGLTVSPGPISRYLTNTRLLKNQTEGYGIGLNPKFAPNLSSLGDGISEAINREKMMGVSPNDIRIGNSPLLKSPDNPYGLGIYNIKDEPLGISQGINRVSGKGLDPKKSGMIPNFADIYYKNINSPFKDPFNREPGTISLGLEESLKLEAEIKKYKERIKLGQLNQDDLNRAINNLTNNFNLTSESSQKIKSRLDKSLSFYEKNQQLISRTSFNQLSGSIEEGGQLTFGSYQKSLYGKQAEFIPIVQQANLESKKILGIGTPYKEDIGEILANKFRRIESFDDKLNSFGLLNLSYFSPKKTRELRDLARESGRQYEAEGVINQAGNRFFTASIIAPLVAGVAQQAFDKTIGNDTTAKRGASSILGGLGNIASYAGLGAAVGGGLPGAAIGGGIGLALEIPSIIKAFSDTLPDLERNLNAVKESATKTNDAFTTYISSSEQLRDIEAGNLKATNFQREELIRRRDESFRNLPSEAQSKVLQLQSQGKFEDAYNVQSIYGTIAAQTQNAISDLKKLNKEPLKQIRVPTFTELSAPQKIPRIGIGATGGDLYEPEEYIRLSKSEINKRIYEASLKRNLYIKQNINPISNSILDTLNPEGLSLDRLLGAINQDTLKNIFTEKNLKLESGELGNTPLQNLLKQLGLQDEQIKPIVGKIKAGTDAGYGSNIAASFQPEALAERARLSSDYREQLKKEQDKADDVNKKWLELSVTGSKAIEAFETRVLNKLSQNLQDLNIKSIQAESAIKIQEIQSGKNPYNSAYFNYQRDLVALRRAKGEEDLSVNADYLRASSNNIQSGFESLFQQQKNTSRSKGLSQAFQQSQFNILKDVLGGTFNISDIGTVSLVGNEATEKNIQNINERAQEKINYLTKQKENIGGTSLLSDIIGQFRATNKAQNLSEDTTLSDVITGANFKNSKISESFYKLSQPIQADLLDKTLSELETKQGEISSEQDLIEGLKKYIEENNKLVRNKNIGLLNNINKLNRGESEKAVQLLATYGENQTAFAFEQQSNIFNQANISRYGEQAFQLERGGLVNPSREGAIRQRYLAQYINQIPGILKQLNTATGLGITDVNQLPFLLKQAETKLSSFGISPTDKVKESVDYKNAAINAQELRRAVQQLGDASKNTEEEISRAIRSLSPFSDVRASALRETNINRAAANQTFSGTDYAKSFLSPLEYNSQTFMRDSISAVQDLGVALKDDLGKNLLSITQGAKNAGDAFKDLGLALLQTVAQKGIDIGINALFGAGVQGLQSVFPALANYGKSGGGYIQKFATGGFVNMGSGTKDDVPALLSGGEFVINKNAVNKIGKNNLDLLNQSSNIQPAQYINNPKNLSSFPGVISDTISASNRSANINLANAYLINTAGTTGQFKVSSLLSLLGQDSTDNPQNKLKFERERYIFGRTQAYRAYQNQLSAYDTQKMIGLGQAYLGLIGLGAFAGLNSSAPTSLSPGMTVGQLSPTTGIDTPDIGPITTNPISYTANGGYIPRFASGGYFGGDKSSDGFRAMVMGGEYVMSPQTVNKYGKSFFNNLNSVGKYAVGGYVSSATSGGNTDNSINILQDIRDNLKTSSPNVNNQSNMNQNNNVTINISMDNNGNANTNSTSSTGNEQNNNQSSTQSKNKETWDKISGMIKTNIIKTITEQSRPGGLLYSNFEKKKS